MQTSVIRRNYLLKKERRYSDLRTRKKKKPPQTNARAIKRLIEQWPAIYLRLTGVFTYVSVEWNASSELTWGMPG